MKSIIFCMYLYTTNFIDAMYNLIEKFKQEVKNQ
jgi:hypothetical protein